MRPAESTSSHSSLSDHAPRSKSGNASLTDVDLRELEYMESDSHLSCPVCHIPFIDPVYVECGHYFCAECLARYWKTARRIGNMKPCPACRSPVRGSKCAPRLIVNMCNDVRVICPLGGCGQVVARGILETHMALYCSEQLFECPGLDCEEKLKRKYLFQDQCRHITHVECECGELVPREDLEEHKEAHRSFKRVDCFHCSHSESATDHEYSFCEQAKPCSGKDLGCDARLHQLSLEKHIKTCSMAKMAPYLKTFVTNSIAPLQHELLRSRQRVEYLEEGIERMHESIHINNRDSEKPSHDERAVDEELHAISSSDPLVTPSASTSATSSPSIPPVAAAAASAEHRHLLALHEDLRHTVADLGLNITQLSRTIEEVDARNSMLTINETLRMKEELALTNNGLYGTRTQVQWLLNRERASQQPGARGRTTAPLVSHPQLTPGPEVVAGSDGNSVGTSPVVNGIAMRPARRTSGGSQERVKL